MFIIYSLLFKVIIPNGRINISVPKQVTGTSNTICVFVVTAKRCIISAKLVNITIKTHLVPWEQTRLFLK